MGLAGTSSPQISSTRAVSDRPREPASARLRSSAWVRSPGTGSPCQVTSSRTASRGALGPSALDGTGPLGGERDGRVARGRRLLLGQRAVRRPEPQREGQRLVARADLVAGVDVEEPDRLEQRRRRPRAARPRRRPRSRRRRRRGRRPPWPAGRSRSSGAGRDVAGVPHQDVEVDLDRGAARRQAERLRRPCGCSSPAWPNSTPPTSDLGAAARVPRRRAPPTRPRPRRRARCRAGGPARSRRPSRPRGPRPTSRRARARRRARPRGAAAGRGAPRAAWRARRRSGAGRRRRSAPGRGRPGRRRCRSRRARRRRRRGRRCGRRP